MMLMDIITSKTVEEPTYEEKLKNSYHELTKRINNLYTQINLTSNELVIDALLDGISMYTKMRMNVFNQIKSLSV